MAVVNVLDNDPEVPGSIPAVTKMRPKRNPGFDLPDLARVGGFKKLKGNVVTDVIIILQCCCSKVRLSLHLSVLAYSATIWQFQRTYVALFPTAI